MEVNARATRYDLITMWRMSEEYIMVLIIQPTININSTIPLRNRVEVNMCWHVNCEISMAPVISVKPSAVVIKFTKIRLIKYYWIIVICPG